MKRQHTKLIVFCVLWAVVVAVAVIGVRYFSSPQRQIDQHLAAMRPLYETMERETGHDASSPVRQEWNLRQGELIKLGYLEKRVYNLPLLGQWAAQERLFNALHEHHAEHWISDWAYRPGPNGGLEVDIVDEPDRFNGWQAVIEGVEEPAE